MRVLALDTTTPAGSVALVDDDRVIVERRGDGSRTHAERLPGDLLALLDAVPVSIATIDLFAVASGPGSFTGLRIGIATMQGLAFARQRRLVGVSALEALAQTAAVDAPADAVVAVWMDAHRREIFSALYRIRRAAPYEPERLDEIEPAMVGDPASTLARWTRGPGLPAATFVGDGATLYRDVIAARAPHGSAVVNPPAIAGAVGRLALGRARRGEPAGPAAIRPLYVRRPDAEIARDARR